MFFLIKLFLSLNLKRGILQGIGVLQDDQGYCLGQAGEEGGEGTQVANLREWGPRGAQRYIEKRGL